MDRWSFLASLGRQTSFGVVIGACAVGCAGTGPAIVEHPRSASMTLVSPERDPLAGTPMFRTESPDATHAAAPTRRVAVTARAPIRVTPSSVHPPLHVADWSLSLGADETAVAPEVAFSAALSMSAGPAPHLAHAYGPVVVPISTVSVEEGAWERRRR